MLIALLQTHPNLVLSEIAALCGYDLLILDDEHGLFSAAEILQSIRLLNATDTAVWVRIREGDTHAIGRYLDMGADGIIATGVRSAEDASRYVRASDALPCGSFRPCGTDASSASQRSRSVGSYSGCEKI